MKGTVSINWKSVLRILKAAFGIGLLAAFVLLLNSLFGGMKTTQMESPPTSPPTLTPAPIPTIPDPTAGWKTYTNPIYGYSIKHPPDWRVVHTGQINEYTIDYVAFADPMLSKASLAPVVAIHVTNRSYVQELGVTRSAIGGQEQDVILANVKGKKYLGATAGPGPRIQAIVLPSSTHTYRITFTPKQENVDYNETVEQMLSTLSLPR